MRGKKDRGKNRSYRVLEAIAPDNPPCKNKYLSMESGRAFFEISRK
jgi:hypothetical protein